MEGKKEENKKEEKPSKLPVEWVSAVSYVEDI